MSITLEAATERIIVCGIDGIEHHVQTQNIGGIVTVTKTNPHEYLDFDISDIPHFTVSLSTTHKTDLKDKARAYLERAADMLKNIGKKKLLIHCDAGLNRSPAFTLFLLLHLSGQPYTEQKIYTAIAHLNQIRPEFAFMENHLKTLGGLPSDQELALIKKASSHLTFAKGLRTDWNNAQTQTFAGGLLREQVREVLTMFKLIP